MPFIKLQLPAIGFFLALLAGCTSLPKGLEPVTDFQITDYLGTWYEIARLDHPFERGLSHVTAEYSLQEDGRIRVVNQGYSARDDKWKSAEGRAVFVGPKDRGHLKVSFFGPFYASYVILELGKTEEKTQYSYAIVTGYNRDYLWLLARTPEVDQHLIDHFRSRTQNWGFDLNELILVLHEGND